MCTWFLVIECLLTEIYINQSKKCQKKKKRGKHVQFERFFSQF